MTKEEIIHRLQYARHRIDNATYAPDVLKAIDIAIEAVGNTDSDTISRAKAIEAIKAARVEDDGTYKWRAQRNLDLEFAAELLETIPPAQPERIKGRWISADAIFGGVPFYCSECGENTRDTTVMGKPRWNFCPNCGAKMESEVTE